ncbi:MAG TPA: POTRA domain-containing protein [Gammaproteobacteria bacterium]|nr:POTRA domain-containing protein [Gammaproteobacteria bacterium]
MLGQVPVPPSDDAALQASRSIALLDAIAVERIELEGNTVLTAAEVAALTAPYENRSVSFEELHELRHTLSRAYVDRGYVSSGVVMPDQRVTGGVVVFQAIEGQLTEIVVQGNRRFRAQAIAKRIERFVNEPLDIADLQASLERIRQDPLIARINAQLLPGAAPGQNYLRLGLTERRPLELEVTGGNDRSASVGEHRGNVAITYRGLIGNGDILSGGFGFTDGVVDNVLSYRVPLTARGVALEVVRTEQAADIVEQPFRSINIESRLESLRFAASYPFRTSNTDTLVGMLGFEHRHSESTLLEMPFSFSPGDVDGRAQGSAVLAGLEWSRREPSRAWAARGTLHIGVDALDATLNSVGPDSESMALTGQFQFLQTLTGSRRVLVRGVVQLARDPLLAMYKLPVGGRYSVRGYRESQFVRDNALLASIEYQLPVALDDSGRARGNVHVAVFADYGAARDEEDTFATSGTARLASAGFGVLWDPIPAFHFELYLGKSLKGLDNSSSSLQDQGIHYRASFNKAL